LSAHGDMMPQAPPVVTGYGVSLTADRAADTLQVCLHGAYVPHKSLGRQDA
jgi:hypothetical protein